MGQKRAWIGRVDGLSYWRSEWHATTDDPRAFGIAVLVQGLYARPAPPASALSFSIVDRGDEVVVSALDASVTLRPAVEAYRDVDQVMWPSSLATAREWLAARQNAAPSGDGPEVTPP